ncbi:hypothetical protein CBM2586_B10210 [Cupriavidus phytorum]|uniref:Uncharacterized protein n=1 Tax=Cupriavidus taiwanensis TaxID=164546 RepID=A0A976A778_9BURK|nr:hypothetical protein [Cupriavidus taiwanensis]SOY65615.1 hypothetical protein CBM2586_B10210 [Cupriavidus taiwanensis]
MTWHPYTTPPQTVGPYRLNDIFGHTHKVQWDGRHFRYAEGQFAGGVVVHYKGDLWQRVEGEE